MYVCLFLLSGIFPLEHFDMELSSHVAAAGHAIECFFSSSFHVFVCVSAD